LRPQPALDTEVQGTVLPSAFFRGGDFGRYLGGTARIAPHRKSIFTNRRMFAIGQWVLALSRIAPKKSACGGLRGLCQWPGQIGPNLVNCCASISPTRNRVYEHSGWQFACLCAATHTGLARLDVLIDLRQR